MNISRIYKNPIPSYAWGLATFIILLIALVTADYFKIITLKREADLLAVAGIPLFIVTVIQLTYSHSIQTADLVRSHISEFISNQELYSAFHELIYAYKDDKWIEVKGLLPTTLSRDCEKKDDNMRNESWDALKNVNKDRPIGSRYYDPDFFQNSIEEQRLDSVLHYFDMLAYNYRRKLISLKYITGVSGYHLAVLGSRDVVKYYLDQTKKFWDFLPYKKRVGAEPPYENLRILLAHIELHNKAQTAKQLQRDTS